MHTTSSSEDNDKSLDTDDDGHDDDEDDHDDSHDDRENESVDSVLPWSSHDGIVYTNGVVEEFPHKVKSKEDSFTVEDADEDDQHGSSLRLENMGLTWRARAIRSM